MLLKTDREETFFPR